MSKRQGIRRLINAVITAFLWCWYGIADKVRLWLVRYKWRKEINSLPKRINAAIEKMEWKPPVEPGTIVAIDIPKRKHWPKYEGDLVSIIMPTIGRDLTKTIESVLAQTHKNWELIIVHDGLDHLLGKFWTPSAQDNRVRECGIPKIVHYPTDDPKYQWLAGPCRAINYGLSRVRGDWIARIDDDDVWHPKHLERALEYAKRAGAEFVSFPIDLNGEYPMPDRFYGNSVGSVQSWLYRSYLKCFKTNLHCWRKRWNAVNDIDLAQRMARAGVKMAYCVDAYPHATIKPRPGLTEVGVKGWLQEKAK